MTGVIPPGYEKAKRRMDKYFGNEISKFVLREIKITAKCTEGLVTALALLLFATVDLFGFLVRDDKERPKATETMENYKCFFQKYFPDVYSQNVDKIVKLFRHGVVHQFFAKASAISRGGFSRQLLYKDGRKDVLNLDVFAKDLMTAIDCMQKQIENDDDRELTVRMNKRLEVLKRTDFDALARHM